MLTLCGCTSIVDRSVILDVEQFSSKIRSKDFQLIDVRTPEEFKSGHLKSAVNINYFSESFKDSLALLDAELPVFIYCKSGKRSSKSVAIFQSIGFDSIYQLKGGFLNWKSHKMVVVSD